MFSFIKFIPPLEQSAISASIAVHSVYRVPSCLLIVVFSTLFTFQFDFHRICLVCLKVLFLKLFHHNS